MRNIHPADELAMIRADLRRLKAREDFLQKGFLSLLLPTRGEDAVATVKVLKHRKFLRERLPQHILNDADLWETEVTRHVLVDEARKVAGRVPVHISFDNDAEIIES